MRALRVLIVAAVGWGCATNPATGRRQLMLMSEAQEINRPPVPRGNQAADGRLQRPGALALCDRCRPAPDAVRAPAESAVDVHRRRRAGRQRVRSAWRIHLPHARHPAVPARRGGTGRRAGHEIGHVDARHSARQYLKQTLRRRRACAARHPRAGDAAGAGTRPASGSAWCS